MNENLKIRLRSECLDDDLIRVFDSGIGKIAVYPSVNDDDCFLNEFVNLEAWLLTTSENEDYDFEAIEFLSGMVSEIDNLESDLDYFVEQLKGEFGEQLSLSF